MPLHHCFFWRSQANKNCVFLFGLLQLVQLHWSTRSIYPSSANAAIPPHPCLQTSYFSSAHFVSFSSKPSQPLMSLVVFLHLLLLFPFWLAQFFNGMLKVFEPGALIYYTLFRAILYIPSAFRNLSLTHLPISKFLDYLLCDLIVPTHDILSPDDPPLALLLFSSGRAYPSLNLLLPLSVFAWPPLSLCGINISQGNSSLSFLNV